VSHLSIEKTDHPPRSLCYSLFTLILYWGGRERFHLWLSFIYHNRHATEGGAFPPPKFSKHCIAILTFPETFKE